MSMISQLLHAYLVGYIYWLMIPLGCTAILMMHHLTGGWWGYPIRRLLEAGSRTFGLMAILFIPILLGMKISILGSPPTEKWPAIRTSASSWRI